MKTLLLLFAIFLVSCQAVPGDGSDALDTLECVRNGGSCNFGPCRGISQPMGTCRNAALTCCRWPRPA
ncbi:gallinacin-9 [Pogona vitticeps]